jgi:hypothetical protein
MSTSDGYVGGVHKIVDHGPNSQRYNIVILGDGYQASEQAKLATDVQTFVDLLRTTAPYTDLWCGINVHRIDVVSTDSGADDPATCGDGSTGSGANPRTYFDSTFCSDGNVRRLLSCNDDTAHDVAIAQVPEAHIIMVIVNTTEYGGSSDGRVAKFSTAASSAEIALHEMGHLAFSFADEYDCRSCVTGETGHDHYGGGEPIEPNVTVNTDPGTIKWKTSLTAPADGLPTTQNADCSKRDSQANPKAANYVGAYAGAYYYHCGAYRPSFNCRMRALGNPFCGVCQQVIRDTLAPFLPAESLTLTTPSITFANIPEWLGGVGVTTYRAIVFEVVTCATRTFRITTGPTGGFGTPLGTVVAVSANDNVPVEYARLWISYTSTTAGASSSGTVTVKCDETGQTWTINITANTVARPKSAVVLVFDHSGSMIEDAGDGITKVSKLREAANIFVNAMLDGDGLGLVRFDDTAQTLMAVTNVGPAVLGAGRIAALGHIAGSELDPAGSTSIGAGVVAGKAALDAAQALGTPHYEVTAMLVLTDGEENTAPMLASVGSSITANTFAIGLGKPENISTVALATLTQGHQGYLLITGTLTPDQAARLNKYFLQILAGITNAQVVLDPHGVLTPGAVHSIPFQVADTDYGLDVFLLTENPWAVDFELKAPNGELLSPASTAVLHNIQYVQSQKLAYYRLSLPADPGKANGTRAGQWHVMLKLGGRTPGTFNQDSYVSGAGLGKGALAYDVVVHSYSNLLFKASVSQSSFDPGATVTLHATLMEYDVPVDHRGFCWAEVARPDGTGFVLAMAETDPGRFSGNFVADVSGLYTMRVRAAGSTFRGVAFQREQTLSAAVYLGANQPPQGGGGGGGTGCCDFLKCIINGHVIDRKLVDKLSQSGLHLDALLKCLEKNCSRSANPVKLR